MQYKRGIIHLLPLILVGGLIVAVIGGMFYFNFTSAPDGQNSDRPLISKQEISSPTPETMLEMEDEMNDWKAYTNLNPSYSIKYPPTWNIDTSKASLAEQSGAELTFKNGEYTLIISWPDAYGPSGCKFSDHPNFGEGPELPPDCPGEYKQFTSPTNIFRRLTEPLQSEGASSYPWSIYTKEVNSDYFVTVPPITYLVPKNYQAEIINEMDRILSTFEFIEKEKTSDESMDVIVSLRMDFVPEGYLTEDEVQNQRKEIIRLRNELVQEMKNRNVDVNELSLDWVIPSVAFLNVDKADYEYLEKSPLVDSVRKSVTLQPL